MQETQHNFSEVQKELRAFGTAQNRKVYARHGADAKNVFGVSFANLGKIAKNIKVDHSLARKLWESGNYDSRNLATKIADGENMDEKEVMRWVKQLDNYVHVSLLGGLIAKHPDSHKLAIKLCAEKDEIKRGLGHSIMSSILAIDPNRFTSKQISARIKHIRTQIHKSPNWARYAMNWALIAIGTYAPGAKDEAISAAKSTGKVEIDHGETNCKTPDAATYIEKAYKHQQQKLAKKK